MAYLLGLIMADGCVYKNTLQYTVAKKDICILEFINKEFKSNYPIRFFLNNGKDGVKLIFHSKTMVEDLYKYNIFDRKTGKEKYPKLLNNELFPHFLRGFFDGDGCITFKKDNKNKRPVVFIDCSSKIFLEQIRNKLSNIGYIRKNPTWYTYVISAKRDILFTDLRD